MEFLRQTWQQVQDHLKSLSASQKLVIALCVALIGVSLAWLVNWSATADMVVLLDQPFTSEQIASAQRELDRQNVAYSVKGDRVYVPADQREGLLASLQQSEALPSDTTIGFAKLLEGQSIWISHEDSLMRRDLALAAELARVIKRFTDVRDARVFIDRPAKRSFGDNRGEPKASVFLQLKSNAAAGRGFVDGIASFVSGAVVGLKPENVSIVDAATGAPYRVRSKDNALAADLLADSRQKEEHYAEKIRGHLAYIPGVLVGVYAEIETEARRVQDRQLKPLMTEEEITSDTEHSASGDGEPGVVPNTGARVPGGASGTNREQTTERTRYTQGDEKIITTQNTLGVIKRLTASINVPRTYFVQVFKQRSGADQEPTEQEVDTLIAEQLPQIKASIRPLINASEDDAVEVHCFYDVASPTADVVLASTGSSIAEMMTEYGRPASLAGLAVLSLTLMIMLVRRAQPPVPLRIETGNAGKGGSGGGSGAAAGHGTTVQILPDGTRRTIEELLTVEGGPVGKAQPTEPILEGREVDEQTLKSQQIIEQVNSLVKDDPDAVASMLRKWIEEPH